MWMKVGVLRSPTYDPLDQFEDIDHHVPSSSHGQDEQLAFEDEEHLATVTVVRDFDLLENPAQPIHRTARCGGPLSSTNPPPMLLHPSSGGNSRTTIHSSNRTSTKFMQKAK